MSKSAAVKLNDFVWAKLARYPPWPAIIMKPDPLAPAPKHKNACWIYFFGSHDYAWVEEKNIKPFKAFRDQYKATYKQIAIREAVEEIEEIIENVENNPEYKIEFVKYTRKERKRSTTRSRKSSESSVDSRKRPLKEKNKPVHRKRSRSLSTIAYSDMGDMLHNDDGRPIVISPKTFGFVAANIYDESIVKNLLKYGHRVQVWSSSLAMCEELQEYADRRKVDFKLCRTKRELVKNCDIIFNHQTDPEKVKTIIKEFGVDDEDDDLLDGKAYVEMSSIDPDISIGHSKLIERKGATYIEAMLQGTLIDAIQGKLMVIASGKQAPFKECSSCFRAMARSTILLGNIGSAAKAQIMLDAMKGVLLGGFIEFFALADKWGVELKNFLQLFKASSMCSAYLENKAEIIIQNRYSDTQEPVQEIQRNLFELRKWANTLRYPTPLASSASEIFKHARRLGYDNQDSASIYNRTRY